MAASLEGKLARLPGERRARVDARAAELIAEKMTLRDLEKRSDMLLSTLRGHVEAMGGELDLVAKFPDRPPVRLKKLAPVLAPNEPSAGKSAAST